MPRSGPRKVHRYSEEFKLTAVRLSQQPGLQVRAVAAALEIHPFMLSKWRKDVREGRLRGKARKAPPGQLARSPSCRSSRRHMRSSKRSTNS
jgi:transposase